MSSFDYSHLPEVSRPIDPSLYSRGAIAAAQAAYKDYCRVETRPSNNGRLVVALTSHPAYSGELRALVLEFWNYVLDRACQERLNQ